MYLFPYLFIFTLILSKVFLFFSSFIFGLLLHIYPPSLSLNLSKDTCLRAPAAEVALIVWAVKTLGKERKGRERWRVRG